MHRFYKHSTYTKSVPCAVRTTVLVSNRGLNLKITCGDSLLKKSIANSPCGLPDTMPEIKIELRPKMEKKRKNPKHSSYYNH